MHSQNPLVDETIRVLAPRQKCNDFTKTGFACKPSKNALFIRQLWKKEIKKDTIGSMKYCK